MKRLVFLICAVFLLVQSNNAFAQENNDEWEFYMAPALWAAGVDSKLQAGSITVGGEVDFDEVLENLKGGLMGSYGAKNGKFSVNGAFLLIGLEAELPALIGALGTRTTEISQYWTHILLGYDLLDMPIGEEMNLKYTQLIGPRYYYNRVVIDRLALLGGGELRDMSNSWVDLVVGGAATLDINDKWGLFINGDIGGFGIGSSSDLAWTVGAFIDYHKSERSTIRIGYKYFKLEKEATFNLGKVDLELEYSGPVFQWIFNF